MKLNSMPSCIKIFVGFILFLIISEFSFSSLNSHDLYADIEIEVSQTGLVTITGLTNYEDFQNIQTHQYTSKNGEMWLLNISVDEVFSEYLFRLILPENSVVNYIRTTPNIRFETVDSRLNIIGVGQNRKFELVVQYSYKEENSRLQQSIHPVIITLFLIFIILLLAIVFYLVIKVKFTSKKLNEELNHSNNEITQRVDPSNSDKDKNISKNNQCDYEVLKQTYAYLPSRQREIISILCEEKQITQRALEKRLNIPKSSVSRNVHSLVIKKIIVKKESGNTNVLELHEDVLNAEN